MEIILEIYQKLKKHPTKEAIRNAYVDFCQQTNQPNYSYREFYQRLTFIHHQEQMRVERERAKAVGGSQFAIGE